MAQEKDNTVSSKNQLKDELKVFGKTGSGKKILFLGNSITRHGAAPQIGWNANWGMAASKEENDYVHQTMKRVWQVDKDASFLVAQIAEWEREFWNENLMEQKFPDAVSYNPDIIIVRVVENVRETEHEGYPLYKGYEKLIEKVNPNGTARVVMTSPFWQAPDRDEIIKAFSNQYGHKYVDMCIGADDRYTAKGQFEHAGVAAHPGDEGMEEIAKRIFEAMKEYL